MKLLRILIPLLLLPSIALAQVASRSGRQTIGTDLSTFTVTPSGTTTPMSMANATMPAFINVKQPPYNAKGDGVTDDTAAIQAAKTAAGAFAKIVLPCPGTYHTTTLGDLACTSRSSLVRGSDTGPNVLQIVDDNALNAQIISLNVESEFNPTSTSSWFNFGGTFEAFDPTANAQNFTGQNYGLYGSYSHFGSGTLSNGFGVAGEAFNPGSNTATLLVGLSGHAHNGGVAAGSPVQTPANTGSATNLRAVSGVSSNEATGTVTEATALYANNCTNTGGGTITNCYGLHVASMSGGTSNRAILTDGGLVEHVGSVFGHAQLSLGLQTPDTSESLWIQPNATLTGTAQYGARIYPKTSSAATADGIGLQVRADTAAATYTQALNIGLHSATPTVGAGSTITEWEGVRVDPGPVAGITYAIRTFGTNDLSMFAGPVVASNSKNKGTITLTAGSGTVTVQSGAICVCSDTTALNACKPSVSGTTLTIAGTGTDAVNYLCL